MTEEDNWLSDEDQEIVTRTRLAIANQAYNDNPPDIPDFVEVKQEQPYSSSYYSVPPKKAPRKKANKKKRSKKRQYESSSSSSQSESSSESSQSDDSDSGEEETVYTLPMRIKKSGKHSRDKYQITSWYPDDPYILDAAKEAEQTLAQIAPIMNLGKPFKKKR